MKEKVIKTLEKENAVVKVSEITFGDSDKYYRIKGTKPLGDKSSVNEEVICYDKEKVDERVDQMVDSLIKFGAPTNMVWNEQTHKAEQKNVAE